MKCDFTDEEKSWMDTVTVNYVIAQSDGFQLGYAQAINDFTEMILDYWRGSDDEPQKSVLDALVDLGINLSERKERARKNVEKAKSMGYRTSYFWRYKANDEPFEQNVQLFTRADQFGEEEDHNGRNV